MRVYASSYGNDRHTHWLHASCLYLPSFAEYEYGSVIRVVRLSSLRRRLIHALRAILTNGTIKKRGEAAEYTLYSHCDAASRK